MSKARGLADLGNVYDDGALSNRNLIINGAMQVAQRGTSQTGASGYLLDRWKKQSATAASATFSQDTSDTPEGFRYALKVLATGSSAFIQLGQAIEFKNMAHVVGKTVTLSYRAKTNLSFDSRIRSRTDTEDAATVFSAATLSAITESASTDWKLFTHTFTVPTATLAMSVDFSAGAVVSGDYFRITGVQLEIGDTATPFEHRSYGQELALCQRYFVNEVRGIWSGTTTNTVPQYVHSSYPVEMRAAPTCTIDATGVAVVGFPATPSLNVSRQKDLIVQNTANATTAYGYFNYHVTADAEL
jgi:hypothetical protein